MKNPLGSNIPQARHNVSDAIKAIAAGDIDEAMDLLDEALPLMYRQAPLKMAPVKQRIKITKEVCDQIRLLAATHPDWTNAEIAVAVGLPSCGSGRVTEVLQGLRE